MTRKGQEPILIAGQTASGKSKLALELAHKHDGVIINADSMQVYDVLQVLTARPSLDEMEGLPHKLFGHVSPATPYSVGQWLRDVETALQDTAAQGKQAIIIGGTGLYFKALLKGLSKVPEIPEDIRGKWRALGDDPEINLHALLVERDPQMAARLEKGDRQRLARALEVFEATGRSLLFWQAQPDQGPVREETAEKYVISIEREKLYARCDKRFDEMIRKGALQEVERLLALNLPPTLPAMGALGVKPLAKYLRGECNLVDATEKAKTETRQYAKRQGTWLRSNMITWSRTKAE